MRLCNVSVTELKVGSSSGLIKATVIGTEGWVLLLNHYWLFHFNIPDPKAQFSFQFQQLIPPTTSGSNLKSQDSTRLTRHSAGDRSRAEKRVLVSDSIRSHVALGRIVQATTEVGVDNRRISGVLSASGSIFGAASQGK